MSEMKTLLTSDENAVVVAFFVYVAMAMWEVSLKCQAKIEKDI